MYIWQDMREGNVFVLSLCLFVQAFTFEGLDIEPSLLVWWNILSMSRSSLSIKAIWSRLRSLGQNVLFGLLDTKFFCYDQLMT